MADILEEIVAYKKKEVEDFKKELSQIFLESRTETLRNSRTVSMKAALTQSSSGIIAEFKRKSPSKGWINRDASATAVPLSYQHNGASAVSILTDSKFFGGSTAYVRMARATKVNIPILFKNFIIDEYQIFQAKTCGASAILLIAACLSKEQCRDFIKIAHGLELEVLLEMHTEEETDYCDLEADMYGINNRNLGTFETDINKSFNLFERLPANAVKVSESGISNPETVKQLRALGYRGFLMGETFMMQPDPGLALNAFISQL